jgi:hypothetical protein
MHITAKVYFLKEMISFLLWLDYVFDQMADVTQDR